MGGTNSLLEYNYLVKKVVFNISVLPVVKIISAMFVHAFFVLFTIILYQRMGNFLISIICRLFITVYVCSFWYWAYPMPQVQSLFFSEI